MPASPHSVTIALTPKQNDRLIRAFLADTETLSKQKNLTFPAWVKDIVFDWVRVVEEETKKPTTKKRKK
jgi:hypothetical protein